MALFNSYIRSAGTVCVAASKCGSVYFALCSIGPPRHLGAGGPKMIDFVGFCWIFGPQANLDMQEAS